MCCVVDIVCDLLQDQANYEETPLTKYNCILINVKVSYWHQLHFITF